MNSIELNRNIGKTIKLIRESKNLKMEYVACKAGYADKTTYSRLEAGKLKHINIDKLNSICEAMECETFQIILLASVKQFKNNINSWPQFVESLKLLPQNEKKKLLSIVHEIFPAQFEVIIKSEASDDANVTSVF
jgi:transcriptional regulator with XRE-family HTH domain